MNPAPPIIEEPSSAADDLSPAAAVIERRVRPVERAAAAFEVILCSGFPTQLFILVLLTSAGMKMRLAGGALSPPFVFALTLLDTMMLVGLVIFFIRARGESVREQLFGSRPTRPELLFGLALIPASFFVVIAVLLLVQLLVPSLRNVPHNPLQDLVHNRWEAVIFAFVVMIAGGVREEIQRSFVLRRLEQYLGGGIVGLTVFSAIFGLGHLEQGRDVALATAVLGAFWGAIFLKRRSIAGPMVGHAGFNLAQVLKFVTFGG